MASDMACWIHEELQSEWRRLVHQTVGSQSGGYDSPTVLLYWRMVEHHTSCEVCRDDEVSQQMKEMPGKP